jgi:hypothetical protein
MTPGGDGGDAGGNGDTGGGAAGGLRGTTGTATTPGGPFAGASGVGGTGASSPINVNGGAGGGGGGGSFGGGGAGNGSGGDSAGGGGGGGSSFVSSLASGGTVNSTTSRVPTVTITYTLPAGTPPPSGGTPNPGGGTTTPGGGSSTRINTYIDSRPRQTVRTSRRSYSAKFEFSSNVDGAKFRCKLDDRETQTCTSGKRYKVGKGKHKFSVRAVKGSRSDTTPATFSFRVADKE